MPNINTVDVTQYLDYLGKPRICNCYATIQAGKLHSDESRGYLLKSMLLRHKKKPCITSDKFKLPELKHSFLEFLFSFRRHLCNYAHFIHKLYGGILIYRPRHLCMTCFAKRRLTFLNYAMRCRRHAHDITMISQFQISENKVQISRNKFQIIRTQYGKALNSTNFAIYTHLILC